MEGRKISSNLKMELENEMEINASRIGLEVRGRYVSDRFVSRILEEEILEAHLRREYKLWSWPWPLPPEHRRLLEAIHAEGQICYCILILIDRPKDIQSLLCAEPAVNDRTLFWRDGTGRRSICSWDELRVNLPQFDDDTIEKFYRTQWHFPPTLCTTDEIPTFDFRHFKMPFDQKADYIGSGSFGTVFGTTIRQEYLQPSKDSNSVLSIAYKRIILPETDPAKRSRDYNEVTILRSRAHSSVAEILGCFISGLEVPHPQGSTQECLYIIYPLAETDMNKWLKTKPDKFLTSIGEELDEHIYSAAMFGLASGVAWLHREIDGQISYHRDLKPENILLFRDYKWNWRITDFGTANVKLREETGTKSITTTKYWAPPEYFENEGNKNRTTHGRSHDVYSLGCILLELATVIAHGWGDAGRPEFERRRCSRKPGHSPADEQSESGSGAFHTCEDEVFGWIKELEERCHENERLCTVLKVIRELLLPYDSRISAWEVDVYLYEATEQWKIDIRDPMHEDPAMTKHDLVVRRLRAVAQESRTIDLYMEVTPVSRAKKWKRSKDFMLALEEKKWIGSSPQMSEDLQKRRREMYGDSKKTRPGSAKIVSTLPSDIFKGDPIFGSQKEFDGIFRGFGRHNVVVLSGLGGIGKSHMALFYASQFSSPKSSVRKHTFWVSMENRDNIYKGYKDIADKINASQKVVQGPIEELVDCIESWLQDAKSEEWILVLDGLDTGEESKKLANNQSCLLDLEKICDYGQILITARSRVCVAELHVKYEHLQLTPPGLDDGLRIYDHFIDKSLFTGVDQDTKDLLESLALPKLIKEAVNYMNLHNIPPSKLLETVKVEEFRGVQEFSPGILKYLLNHLLREDLKAEYFPPEVQKLFILAMFRDGASERLLKSELDKEEHFRLSPILGILQNSSLVQRSGPTNHQVYRVEKTVQAAIWAYIDREEGGLGFLRRFNKTLSMMYTDHRRNFGEKSFMTFVADENLSSTFERFLKFTQDRRGEYPYKVDIAASSVRAIIEFSRALCDQDRYSDATQVLDFARAHYSLPSDNPEDARKRFWVSYKLDQQMMKTYLSRPAEKFNYSTNSHWNAAERIATKLMKDVDSWKQTDYAFENKMKKWELSLDLVRVRYYLKQWDEAKEQLDLIDEINITISDETTTVIPEPILADPAELGLGINGTLSFQIEAEDERRARFRHIAVRKAWIEGLFYYERGQHADARGKRSEAKQFWESAKEALSRANLARISWEPKSETLAEISVHLADANTKLGTGLEKALSTFKDALEDVKKKYGSRCMRAWDLECRINAVKLKTRRDLDKVVSSLENLLGHYEASFGEQAAPTVRCANQLMEAYAKTNRWRDAEKLSERIQVPQRSYVDRSEDWALSGAVAVVVCGICSIWAMRRGNVLRLWLTQGTGAGLQR